MTVKVVANHSSKLIPVVDIRTGGDKVTTRQCFVEGGIISPIKLIDRHLPDIVGFTGTVLRVAVATMGHLVEQGVRPDGHTAQGSCYRGVINEKLILHHAKLDITPYPEIRGSNPDNASVGDVSEPFDN